MTLVGDPYASVEAPPAGVAAKVKPRLRGRMHQVAAFLAVPAGIALFWQAGGLAGHVGASVYALTLVALYGVSALYHVHHWEPGPRQVMKRLDHSMIFVFIAGSYTPFCLFVLHGRLAMSVLVAAWAGAVLGVATQLHPRWATHKAHNALYIVLGWLVIVGTPQLVTHLSWFDVVLLFGGGLLYTLGAIFLAARWPDPWPRTFGFHEVWHAMVIAACLFHYVAVWRIV